MLPCEQWSMERRKPANPTAKESTLVRVEHAKVCFGEHATWADGNPVLLVKFLAAGSDVTHTAALTACNSSSARPLWPLRVTPYTWPYTTDFPDAVAHKSPRVLGRPNAQHSHLLVYESTVHLSVSIAQSRRGRSQPFAEVVIATTSNYY